MCWFFFKISKIQSTRWAHLILTFLFSFSSRSSVFVNHLIAQVLEIPISYENFDDPEGSPECEFVPRTLPKQPESVDTKVSELSFFLLFQNKTKNLNFVLSVPITFIHSCSVFKSAWLWTMCISSTPFIRPSIVFLLNVSIRISLDFFFVWTGKEKTK